MEFLSPKSYKKIQYDIRRDDFRIKELEDKYNLKDEDYTEVEPKLMGIYLEYWVCMRLHCPGCGGKFVKYAYPNMPVIDIRCSNLTHNIETEGPIYYQVKTTTGANFANGGNYPKYFSLKDNYIHVGSKRFGFNCHNIKYTDNKDILIGYICIEYNEDETKNKIKINANNSFIIKPKCNYEQTDQKDISDDYYYRYIDNLTADQKDIISINKNLCYIIQLKIMPININIKFDYKVYHLDPPPLGPVFLYKYLKYKTRYISLKKQIK